MLSLRNRFGVPGVISVLALVFALVGGAYAASGSGDGAGTSAKKNRKGKQGGLNGKQKRQVIAIAKRFQGTGPAGPQGLPGAAGAQGPKGDKGSNGSNGSDGSNGSNGSNGVSVAVSEEPAFGECGDASGYKLESAGGTDYVCNGLDGEKGDEGEKGDPWTAGGTLPENATETGAWGLIGEGFQWSEISFPIPLASALDEEHVHLYSDGNFADFDEGGSETVGCTGSATAPTAPSGHLCVYKGTEFEAAVFGIEDTTGEVGKVSAVGGIVNGGGFAPAAQVRGAWAVTG